jgi:hypothetical protein
MSATATKSALPGSAYWSDSKNLLAASPINALIDEGRERCPAPGTLYEFETAMRSTLVILLAVGGSVIALAVLVRGVVRVIRHVIVHLWPH